MVPTQYTGGKFAPSLNRYSLQHFPVLFGISFRENFLAIVLSITFDFVNSDAYNTTSNPVLIGQVTTRFASIRSPSLKHMKFKHGCSHEHCENSTGCSLRTDGVSFSYLSGKFMCGFGHFELLTWLCQIDWSTRFLISEIDSFCFVLKLWKSKANRCLMSWPCWLIYSRIALRCMLDWKKQNTWEKGPSNQQSLKIFKKAIRQTNPMTGSLLRSGLFIIITAIIWFVLCFWKLWLLHDFCSS